MRACVHACVCGIYTCIYPLSVVCMCVFHDHAACIRSVTYMPVCIRTYICLCMLVHEYLV